jgi:hypothetical protein
MNYLKETEWQDIKVAIDGKPVTGIRNVSYKKGWEDEALYGAGSDPIGIQSGNKSYEGSIKLLKNELDALNTAAKALGFDDISDVPGIVITVAYMPKGGRILKTDTMTGCKISEINRSMEQGGKFMEIDLPFKFLALKSA